VLFDVSLQPANYPASPEEPGLGSGPWGEVFFCHSPRCHRAGATPRRPFQEQFCDDCPHRDARDICRQDAYVLATIAEEDEFALETAHHTLDSLVRGGFGHFLSELFRCASPEVRVDLWTRLTGCHPGSLHLLNERFEGAELPPVEPGEWPARVWLYREAACGIVRADPVGFPAGPGPADLLAVAMAG